MNYAFVGIFIVYMAGALFYILAVERFKEGNRYLKKAKDALDDARETLKDASIQANKTEQSLREAQEMRRQASAILSFVQQKTSVGRVSPNEGKQ